MPEGLTLAALWDTQMHAYTALSKPFEVAKNRVAAIPFDSKTDRADLVVLVEKHGLSTPTDPLLAHVMSAGERIDPAVVVRTARTVNAVWYELQPGAIELFLGRDEGEMRKPFLVSLQEGRISRVSVDLQKDAMIWSKRVGETP